jgi:threonine 3-dehydrogenase
VKALRKIQASPGADFVEIPVPEPGPHDLLVKVKAAALCKSDVDVLEWTTLVQAAKYPLPFTIGHEFAGEVVKVGELVTNYAPGDRVAGETHIPCGTCRECRTGNAHICANHMGVLGRTYDGCFADYIKLPEKAAIRLAPNADFKACSMYEPLGVAIHALQKAKPWGANIAILGTGTIGLMACEAAKALGASRVFAVSRNPKRLDFSLKVGADLAINSKEKDWVAEIKKLTVPIDAILEFSGNHQLINQAIDVLAIGGRLIFVGMVEDALTIPSFMYRVVYRELIVTGLFGRHLYTTWDILGSLIGSGRVKLEHYVGEVIPLKNYTQGLEHFDDIIGRAILIPEE